jgi:hypothetical protein
MIVYRAQADANDIGPLTGLNLENLSDIRANVAKKNM